MKALITGAQGFVGRNLCAALSALEGVTLLPFDLDTEPKLLEEYAAQCDFVFHLAGVNRPLNPAEYAPGNAGFTGELMDILRRQNSRAPVLFTSSVQAELDNPYGLSKRAAEERVFAYGLERDVPVYVYRLSNLFGKWCRPYYNSVIATFCHQAAHGLPLTVEDPGAPLTLSYIDDVIAEFLKAMAGNPGRRGAYCAVWPEHNTTVGQAARIIESFENARAGLYVPDLQEPFTKALYATYLTYLPEEKLRRELAMHTDSRGSFTELMRTPERGQVSVNVSRPGVIKGDHWHCTKHERFVAVAGRGAIHLRPVGGETVLTYYVSGDKLEAVDIPPGWTHSIENLGDTDLVTVMWASECFDPQRPDTRRERVMPTWTA